MITRILLKCVSLAFFLTAFIGFSFAQEGRENYHKAVAELNAGNYSQAFIYIEESLSLYPENFYSLNIKADILRHLRHYKEATITIERAMAINPIPARSYYNKGLIFQDIHKPDSAIGYFYISLSKAKTKVDSAKSLNCIGLSKRLVRDYQGSYDDLLFAHQLNPQSTTALSNLSVTCNYVGKEEESLVYLFKAIAIDSTDAGLYANVGFAYQLDSMYEKSQEYYEKAIILKPTDAFFYSNRSFNKLKLGDLKGAMEDINYSIKLMYNNSWAYRNRALIYIEMGEKKKACKDLNTAVEYGYTRMYGDEVAELLKEHCE